MALDTAYYLVTDDIARRSGMYGKRYVIKDGRHVLNNKELGRVRFTSDEYVSGLSGVTKIDEATARTLIAENGYKMASTVRSAGAESAVAADTNNTNVEQNEEEEMSNE